MADEKFELVSSYQPTGDQPQAIETLVEGVERGDDETSRGEASGVVHAPSIRSGARGVSRTGPAARRGERGGAWRK